MVNQIAKNIREKAVDGILDGQTEWQWFIDELENTYQYEGSISNWKAFLDKRSGPLTIFNFLLKIQGIQDYHYLIKKPWLNELDTLARYCHGNGSIHDFRGFDPLIDLLDISAIVARDLNADNGTSFTLILLPLVVKNVYEIIKLSSVKDDAHLITALLLDSQIAESQTMSDILKNNIEERWQSIDKAYLDQFKNDFSLPQAFQMVNKGDSGFHSWQENYVIDMLDTRIENGKIIPAATFTDGSSVPDIKEWTPQVLAKLRSDFKTFPEIYSVIEMVDYVVRQKTPSEDTQIRCFECALNLLADPTQKKRYWGDSPIFSFIGKWVDDKTFSPNLKPHWFPKLFAAEEALPDSNLCLLEELGMLLSSKARDRLRTIHANAYRALDTCHDAESLLYFLKSEENAKFISRSYFRKAHVLFRGYIRTSSGVIISDLFIGYEIFLIRCKTNPRLVDQLCDRYLIEIKHLWRNVYYRKSLGGMSTFTSEPHSFSSDQINQYSQGLFNNPFLLAAKALFYDRGALLFQLQMIGKTPFSSACTAVQIDERFPFIRHRLFDKRTASFVYAKKIKDCLSENAERILNSHFDDDQAFENRVFDQYEQSTGLLVAPFFKVKELYAKVSKGIGGNRLLPYPNPREIKMAHVSQLFPYLENEIRDLGERYNIVPTQVDDKKYWLAKEPGPILKGIIDFYVAYTGGSAGAADLIFIDLTLYSSDGLNVRNECIHGQRYQKGNELLLAFKLTLFSIAMIQKRLGRY